MCYRTVCHLDDVYIGSLGGLYKMSVRNVVREGADCLFRLLVDMTIKLRVP
jgi:hypothetical protein